MKLSKTAKGLSSQLAPVLDGIFDTVYKATDKHKARMIAGQLKAMVKLAIAAKESGLSQEQFMAMLTALDIQQASVINGRIEFTAAVSSGIETVEGKQFSVDMSAGGSIAGFGLEAEAGYSQDSRNTMYERSSQNMRIRLDFASVPMQKFDSLVDSMAQRIFESGSEVEVPQLTDDQASPILEALESYLPVIKSFIDTENE